MKLEFSKYAETRLDGIYDFLSEKSVLAAARLYNDILDEIERLLSFPQMASVESLLEEEPQMFRSLIINRQYKVIYYIDGETIYIVDVWDCRQNPVELTKSVKKKK